MDRGDTFLIKCRDNSVLDLCIVPDEQEILESGQIRHKDVELLRSFACRSIGELKQDASVSAQGLLLLGEIKNINREDKYMSLRIRPNSMKRYQIHRIMEQIVENKSLILFRIQLMLIKSKIFWIMVGIEVSLSHMSFGMQRNMYMTFPE